MRWKSRFISFTFCFAIGFAAAGLFGGRLWEFLWEFLRRQQTRTSAFPCANGSSFDSPEAVLAALKSSEVSVRRNVFSELLLRPDINTVYFDYERDLNFPERADRARLQYVQLDTSSEPEALLTFVRFEHPVAMVFKQKSCGWELVAAVSSWSRFEDYPYENWLSLPEALEPGVHQLLIRDSYGDSSSYVRKARLLKLNGDALTQVAEIDEETIEPVRNYNGADWTDVKHHRINRYKFASGRAGEGPNIVNEVTEEVIKLNGAAPRYSYWLETDGSWHARESNWSRRPAARMYLLGISTEVLIWNSQEGRFVQS